MSTVPGVWTCPECEVTEHLAGPYDQLAEQQRLAQLGHGERHAAERARATTIAEALLDAIEQLAAFRVRLVVAPADLERVRAMVVRRGVAIEVFAGDVPAGRGYVMTPRRGVRELHAPDGGRP